MDHDPLAEKLAHLSIQEGKKKSKRIPLLQRLTHRVTWEHLEALESQAQNLSPPGMGPAMSPLLLSGALICIALMTNMRQSKTPAVAVANDSGHALGRVDKAGACSHPSSS